MRTRSLLAAVLILVGLLGVSADAATRSHHPSKPRHGHLLSHKVKAKAKHGKHGKRGKRGRRGRRGFKGATGKPGPQGPAGPAGPIGPQGPAGNDGAPGAPAPAGPDAVQLRVLGINDLHGNISPPSGSNANIPTGTTGPNGTGAVTNTVTGGAAYLATHIKDLEATAPGGNAMLVGAGDLIGASPLNSGLFHDEPTILSLNAMGMSFSSVGNHEFDEGIGELERMQHGGCHPVDGCYDPANPFPGATFDYLAANVRFADTDNTIFPPYEIKMVGGVPVAFIGEVLHDTPTIVTPDGVKGLQFDDEVTTTNRLVRQLADNDGVQAFVVLIHQGGFQNPPYANGFADVNRCDNPSGDIFPLVQKLDPRVDVVMSAHTHVGYVCNIGGKVVTQASSFGRLVTQLDLTLSTQTKDVTAVKAQNVLVTRDVTPDPTVQGIVDKYTQMSAAKANMIVGHISATLSNTPDAAGEEPLGDVIADSQLDATMDPDEGGAVIAFMNPGGIRANIPYSEAGRADGAVTYNDAYTVQPFANTLTTKDLTGQMIKDLLEQQFDNGAAGATKFLQVSRGFAYSYSAGAAHGSHIASVGDITLNGTPLVAAKVYRVEMNNFLATGGDNFTVFKQGTNQQGGAVDIDAFVDYLMAHNPLTPPAGTDRITKTP